MSPQRPWPSTVAKLLLLLLIAAAAAPASSLNQPAGRAEDPSRTGAERAPNDALNLWLHRDGGGHSRIVLETARGAYVGEWRSGEVLDERTRREVRRALGTVTPPSRAVLINVRPEIKFVTLKGLMLAVGSKEKAGYRTYVEVVAQFPGRVLGVRR